MSDDEYYANSAYDDFEDYLWDDNVSEDAADNLAEHSLPSPIYQEDPHYETLETYSDWDYYSDDFFDDDPTLLTHQSKGDPTTESRRQAKHAAREPQDARRGTKRKLEEMDNIPVLDLSETAELEKCIKGVVWARPQPYVSAAEYQEGQNERVALMKDWKDMFHQHAPSTKKRKTLRDESWANDLSLEDMGLKSAKEQGIAQDGMGIALAEDDEQSTATADEEDDLIPETDDEPASVAYPLRGTRAVLQTSTQPMQVAYQKTADLPSPPTSNESTVTDSVAEDRYASAGEPDRAKRMLKPGKDRSNHGAAAQVAVNATESAGITATSRNSKKRKADIENEETTLSNGMGSTASSRAKRVASTKLASVKDSHEDKPARLPVARSKRS